MADKPRLVISEDDLDVAAAPAPSLPSQPAEPTLWSGGSLPSVESVRRPVHAIGVPPSAPPTTTAAPTSFLRSIRGQSLIAGLVGIALGWAIGEILGLADADATSEAAVHRQSAVWVGVLGAVYAVVFNGWEHIQNRHWSELAASARRSAPWGLLAGAAAGYLASVVYVEMIRNAFEDISFEDLGNLESNLDLYLARTVGWAVFGGGVGAATAAVVRSSKKLQNGVIGGLVGGALGGVLFHWLAFNIDSDAFGRLLGVAAVGGGIGLAIGIVETVRRDAWLHVVGGGMVGKEFILYEAQTSVGASPKCGVTLIKDPGIQPYHFMIGESGATRTLTAYEGATVLVNGSPVAQHVLRDGDVVQVGQTSLRYAERVASL